MNKNISTILSIISVLAVVIGGSISYGQLKEKASEIADLSVKVDELKEKTSADTVRFEYIQGDLSEIKELLKEMSKTHYET